MIDLLIGPVSGLLDKFVEDKDEKNKLAHEIATMAEKQAHAQVMAQIEVNKAEAQHSSIFVAGWRPFVGWVCGFALLYHFIAQPVIVLFSGIETPTFDMNTLTTILMGMLGLGGLRTFEKSKGIARGGINGKK